MMYSRSEPSPRYAELLSLYKDMHEHGERANNLPAAQTFAGQSLPRQAVLVKQLIDRMQPATLLDYGSGKGVAYTQPLCDQDGRTYDNIIAFWGVDSVTCYDPGYQPYSALPSGQFDGVICTDVLEHCPVEDMPWIVDELFAFARKFVFANIATYPAKKHLPNGENAHCTVQPLSWWETLVTDTAKTYPDVRYIFMVESIVAEADGQSRVNVEAIAG